jgi:hypothetical protein
MTKSIGLQLLPTAPAFLVVHGGPDRFTSGAGWGPALGDAALSLYDSLDNPIYDGAPEITFSVQLDMATAPNSIGASSEAEHVRSAAVLKQPVQGQRMTGGRILWPALKEMVQLTEGGRTGTYILRIEGHRAAGSAADDTIRGSFNFAYFDPEQMEEEEKELAQIESDLPEQHRKEKALKQQLKGMMIVIPNT